MLVVDDEPAVRTSLSRALALRSFAVETAADGREALDTLGRGSVDAVVLDLMMPGVDGIEVCRRLRAAGDRTPVLMLTARDAVDDRVSGLDAGADDYVVKPFALEELLARVRAVLRRTGRLSEPLQVGDLLVDESTGDATRAGRPLGLTPTELRLVAFLARNRGKLLSKTQILTQVWGYDAYDPNLVEVHVSALRRKLETDGSRMIHTVRGVGYRLVP